MKYYINEIYTRPNGQRIMHCTPYATYAEAQQEFEQMMIDIKMLRKDVEINRHLVNTAIVKYVRENGEEVKYSISLRPAEKKDYYRFSDSVNYDHLTLQKVKL